MHLTMKLLLTICIIALAVQSSAIYGQTGVDLKSIPFDMGTVSDDSDARGVNNKLFDMGTTEPAQVGNDVESILPSQPSGGGTTPGYRVEDALPSCERFLSGEADTLAQFCGAFFLGTANLMKYNCAAAANGFGSWNALSTEPGYSTEAAIQAFINYARARPEKWNLTMGTLVPVALSQTFPCEATSN